MATRKETPEVAPVIDKKKEEAKAPVTPSVKPGYTKVKLFKDNDKYKDDVMVAINGKTWLIQRGVWVEVPENVALVLEESLAQDTKTANMISKLSGDADF